MTRLWNIGWKGRIAIVERSGHMKRKRSSAGSEGFLRSKSRYIN